MSMLSRTAVSQVTERLLRVHAKVCCEAPSLEMARALRQGVVDRYAKTLPAAVACFEDDFEARHRDLRFPIALRPQTDRLASRMGTLPRTPREIPARWIRKASL